MTAPISVQLYSLREEAKQGLAPILERLGYKLERAKTNIGLGRVTNTPDESIKKEEPVPAMR
jgi:hypothetical protein